MMVTKWTGSLGTNGLARRGNLEKLLPERVMNTRLEKAQGTWRTSCGDLIWSEVGEHVS